MEYRYQKRKEAMARTGRERKYFDLTKHARDLLEKTSEEQHIPQVSLIEMMIRRYCEPHKERKNSDF